MRPEPELAGGIIAALSPRKKADFDGVWLEAPFLLAQASTRNTPQSCFEEFPCRCHESGLIVVSWVRLDNRDELLAILNLPREAADPQLILAAYRRWGENCVLHLVGEFSFAIADPATKTLFMARDPFGVRPLYYCSNSSFFAFATTPAVFSCLDINLEPDQEWMALYLANLSASYTATAYKEVLKLPPGHSMTISAGKENLRRYFHFKDDAPFASRRSDIWVEEYREKLEEAVRCRLQSDYPIGCELSGGLDSATIASFAARISEKPRNIHAFGLAMMEFDSEYINETSRFCGISNCHVITDVAIHPEEILARYLDMAGVPPERMGSIFPAIYDRCQQLDIRTLLSGYGGDEIVTLPGHQLRLELLLNCQYRVLWENLPGNPLTRVLRYGKAVKNFLHPPEFNPLWYRSYNGRMVFFILRKEIMERLAIGKKHMDVARYDAPYRRINDLILQRTISPAMVERLENCSLMAKSYGIDFSWPLLDVRLVQQYLSTPAIEKASGKWNRFLHRRAIDGVVSPRVQWKPDKSMGKQISLAGWQAQRSAIATKEEAELHPAIEELIDRKKFRRQIELAGMGNSSVEFIVQFGWNVSKIRWLNHWLRRT